MYINISNNVFLTFCILNQTASCPWNGIILSQKYPFELSISFRKHCNPLHPSILIFCVPNTSNPTQFNVKLQYLKQFVCKLVTFDQPSTTTKCLCILAFTTTWANSADDKLMIIFFIFPRKTGFNISCKLSQIETIYMKCQMLFHKKNKKKYLKILSAANFTYIAKCQL